MKKLLITTICLSIIPNIQPAQAQIYVGGTTQVGNTTLVIEYGSSYTNSIPVYQSPSYVQPAYVSPPVTIYNQPIYINSNPTNAIPAAYDCPICIPPRYKSSPEQIIYGNPNYVVPLPSYNYPNYNRHYYRR